MQELPNLDLMRSFAVLLVVLSHLLLYTGNIDRLGYSFWFEGLIGVFLFFVHTTLVLMWSLDRDPHTLRFYVRRAFRIYPLWLAVLCLSVAIHLPTSPAFAPSFQFLHVGPREFLENATLTFNLGKGCRLIGAAWSLPIEVQMYIVLPFLFFFMRSNPQIWPLLLVDLLAMVTSRTIEPALSQSLLFCTPLFLPGAIAYLGFKKYRPMLPAWLFAVWLIAITAAFNSWASASKSSFRSGWFYALLVGITLPLFRQITSPALRRVSLLIARYSYGIYLCHFAAITVGVHYLQHRSLVLRIAGFFATIVILPVIFYHALEKPMIRLGSRFAARLRSGPEPKMNEQSLRLEPAP